MNDDHLLNFNPHKVIRCLTPILTQRELEKVRGVLRDNVQQLLRLGRLHLRFAQDVDGPASWRQRVSRGYYCAYCTSRAVRLAITGVYNRDPGDHKKIGNLPEDFPSKTIWEDFLTKFKADRNIADYDHTESEKALEIGSIEYVRRAYNFYRTARRYLTTKGVI
jgi:hypothetical protein